MRLAAPSLLTIASLLVFQTEIEAQNAAVHVRVSDLGGNLLAGTPVLYVDAQGELVRADAMPDGTCMLFDPPSKLALFVEDPTAGAVPLQLRLPDAPLLELGVCVDGAGAGKVDLGPPTRDSALAHATLSSAGDLCSQAVTITGEGTFAYSTLAATTDGDGDVACFEMGSNQIVRDLWYSWTAPQSGTVTVTDGFLAAGDSKLAVYQGDCTSRGALLGCDDDSSGPLGLQSRVTFTAVAGETYTIRIGDSPAAFRPGSAGFFQIASTAVPANDLCEDATTVAVPSTTAGSSLDSTLTAVPNCAPFGTNAGVWYSFIGTGNQITASLCNATLDYDSQLSVYCGPCDNLTCVVGDDDTCGVGSEVSFCSEAGVSYKVLVHGFGGATGNFSLELTDDGTPCGTPTRSCEGPVGACCLGQVCRIEEQHDCEAAGGLFQGQGTDCCGTGVYSIDLCLNAFEDISPTGADLGFNQLDQGTVVQLGFNFEFFGEMKTEIGVSSNGYLTFGSDLLAFANTTIPDEASPNDYIAPLWDDFDLSAGGAVYVQADGMPGSRRFIAQWTNVPQFGMGDSNTFQAILHEEDSCIEFRYLAITPQGPVDDYTVGVENASGLNGASVPGATIGNAQCLRVCDRQGPACGCLPLVMPEIPGDDDFRNFSALDGSPVDLDRTVDNVLTLCGLRMSGSSAIFIDVVDATIKVFGEVDLDDSAYIGAEVTPDVGPTVSIDACGDVIINGNARVRANGRSLGGTARICSKSDIRIISTGNIEADATQTLQQQQAGSIYLQARYKVLVEGVFAYLSARGPIGGLIDITSCGAHPDAIRLASQVNATGLGGNGIGGSVFVTARQGGVQLPGINNLSAFGAGQIGQINVTAGSTVSPSSPFTIPTAWVVQQTPDGTPCECFDFSTPVPCLAGGNDCNNNNIPDGCELDCNFNFIADDCEVLADVNMNGLPDICEVGDCDMDGIPDSQEIDCNGNLTPDECEIFIDCNLNLTPDECEPDCDLNSIPDDCDITNGAPDCNSNGQPDVCDLVPDCNTDGIPDSCQLAGNDCNTDLIPDDCQLVANDCNTDTIPDDCQLANNDCDTNLVPDDCQPNVDGDGFIAPCDCDDNNADVFPGAPELCDGLDNDCDFVVPANEIDDDGDGISECEGDCDDTDANVNPGATEVCNGIDDDCDGMVDEGFDMDGDGFTTCGGDCDDTDAAINPAAMEVCDMVDNDCDGMTDEGFDTDGDGFTTCGGDCDDSNPNAFPGAPEIFGNGVDEDCSGADDPCPVFVTRGTGLLGVGVGLDVSANSNGLGGGSIVGGAARSDAGDLWFQAGETPIFGALETSVLWAFAAVPVNGAEQGLDNWMKLVRDGDGAVSWARFEFDFTVDATLVDIPLYVMRPDGSDFPLAEAVGAAAGMCDNVADNDDCSNPTILTTTGTFPFDLTSATTDGLPLDPMVCDMGMFGSEQIFNDVWYCFQSPVTGDIRVTTVGLAGFDTRLAVYDGCAEADPADVIACNDDFDGNAPFEAGLDFAAVQGSFYKIRLGTFSAATITIPGQILITELNSPVNDDCANPTAVGTGTFPFDLTFATTDGLPLDPLVCDPGKQGSDQIFNDVWYCFTAPANADYDVTTFGLAGFDTRLAVYDGCAGGDPMDVIACNDDVIQLSPFEAGLFFSATAGSMYKIRLGGFDAGTFGSGDLLIQERGAPANDDCINAAPIDEGLTAFDTTLATLDGQALDPMVCDMGPLGSEQILNDVWYCFTAPATADYRVSTVGLVLFDTRLAVYDNDCGPDDPSLVIACNDDLDANTTLAAELIFPAMMGTSYKVRLGGFSPADFGAGRLLIEEVTNVESLCFGDGNGTTCPCGNDDTLNTSSGGCLNSAGTGAELSTNGDTSVGSNSIEFGLTGANTNSFAILVSGDNALGGGNGILGMPQTDGLRCVGGNFMRHGSRPTDANGDVNNQWGSMAPPTGIIGSSGFGAGETRYFQAFYREAGGPCATDQNTSQAIGITFNL